MTSAQRHRLCSASAPSHRRLPAFGSPHRPPRSTTSPSFHLRHHRQLRDGSSSLPALTAFARSDSSELGSDLLHLLGRLVASGSLATCQYFRRHIIQSSSLHRASRLLRADSTSRPPLASIAGGSPCRLSRAPGRPADRLAALLRLGRRSSRSAARLEYLSPSSSSPLGSRRSTANAPQLTLRSPRSAAHAPQPTLSSSASRPR